MNYKKKPKEQLTMYLCDSCNSYLNTTEYYCGTTCGRCINKAKGIIIAPDATRKDKLIAEQLQRWEMEGDSMLLEKVFCNFMGADFLIEIRSGKDLIPMATITNNKKEKVYADRKGTIEGRNVLEYAKSNSLIKNNVE